MLALFPFLVTDWNTWALATYSLGVAADLCFFTKICPAVSMSVSSASAPRRGGPPCPCLAPSRRSRTGTPGTRPQCWTRTSTDSWRRGRAWTRRAAQPPTSTTSWLCYWWPTEAAGWCWPCRGLVTMTWKVLLSKIMLLSYHTTHLRGCFLGWDWRCPGTSWTRVSCSCWPSPDPGLRTREAHCWGDELSTFHILLPILNFTFSFINISSLLSFLVLPRLFVGFSLTSTHQHHHRGLPQHSTNTTGVP